MTNSEAKEVLKMMVGVLNLIVMTSDKDSIGLFTQLCSKYNDAAEIACILLDDQIELEKNGGK